jgi:site-specific recombinase XerD
MKDNHQGSPLFFSMTFEFLETYLPRQCGRSLHTVESYRDALSLFRRYVLAGLGISVAKFTFEECTRDCVLGFMAYLADSNSKPGSRNQRLAALKSYMAFAADKDVALQSMALQVRRVPQCKVPYTEKAIIPEDAMAELFRQPANTRMGLRDRMVMIMLYDSGARLAEILGLHITDAMTTGDNPHVRVNGKGGRQRIVPISMKTAGHLAQYISVFHGKGSPQTTLLFYTVVKGKPGQMSEGNAERFLKAYADSARLAFPSMPEHVYPHMLRRTRATELYQKGVSLPLVSRLLGHANLETTKIYAKPSLKMLRDAIESVETPFDMAKKPVWLGNEEMMAKLNGLR